MCGRCKDNRRIFMRHLKLDDKMTKGKAGWQWIKSSLEWQSAPSDPQPIPLPLINPSRKVRQEAGQDGVRFPPAQKKMGQIYNLPQMNKNPTPTCSTSTSRLKRERAGGSLTGSLAAK